MKLIIITLATLLLQSCISQKPTAYQVYLKEYNLPNTPANQIYFLDVFSSTDEYTNLLIKYKL